ncbi:uncharacterized protein LOC114712428 [Neltuma alba]|uniref:uncharacterized protein LOC114712428 n=1 Tax=Neltuma alba TaxID=207710 RepID=UPI0010A2E0CC|nr:uncharacterized protein LOC114712428 [Prosopis alba]
MILPIVGRLLFVLLGGGTYIKRTHPMTFSVFVSFSSIMREQGSKRLLQTGLLSSCMRTSSWRGRENSVSCVLYDECATNVCMTDFTKMDAPVVILIQLARIGFDEKGKVEICSAFHATKISFNMNYPEVRQFIESAKTFPSPTISTISASVASQTSNTFESTLLSSHPLIPIADIPKQRVDDFFLIKCKVIKLETTHDWKYEACTRCGCKPKEEAGKKTCLSSVCRKRPLYFEWKMRVHYTVEDESGRVVVAFFEKLVREFVGKTLAQLEEELIKVES